MIMGKKKQQEILAAVALGMLLGTGSMFAGAGMNQAQAASGSYTVKKPSETISSSVSYSGSTGGSNPTSVIYVPRDMSGGTITIKGSSSGDDTGYYDDYGDYIPGNTTSSDLKITGNFISTASDTGKNTINASGIQLAYGYKGILSVGDGTTVEVTGRGPRLRGSAIHSEQSGTGTDPIATAIGVGDDVKLSYEITDNDTNDATVYGIYNSLGTLTAGSGLTVTLKNQNSKLAANGNLTASGIFNRAGSVMTIGDSLQLLSDFSAAGETTGTVSGIDSGRKGEPLNHFTLGNDATVKVYFTGDGKQNNNPDVLSENGNALGMRSLYLANSQFSIGNNETMRAQLQRNSTADVVAGTIIRSSNGTIGDSFSQYSWAIENTKVDLLNGFTAAENSKVTAGEKFYVEASSNGFANQSQAVTVTSGSSLTTGNKASIRNEEFGEGSSDQEKIALGVTASGNSQVTLGDDSSVKTEITNKTKNIASVMAIDLENSQMKMGKNADIEALGPNNTYDDKSLLYGVNVFKSNANAVGDADIQIGEGSQILVAGNNAGTMVGLRNSLYGTASLGDDSTITVVQTSADPREDVNLKAENTQQGSAGLIAGYQGSQAKKTTLGKNVILSVAGNTGTSNAVAYGSDNAYGELEAGDGLTVTMNTKGYANAFGLSTIGYNSTYPGTTAVGKNLTVNMTSDGTAYGIYNGNTQTGDAQTIVEDNPTVTVNAKKAIGISNIGSQSTVVLGDNATVTTDGTAASYGVLNQYGANTTFNGAATLTAQKGSELGTAAASYDEGSLIDITGAGRKLITGNLNTVGGGTIHLDMATGDSVLTGASTVNNGTTPTVPCGT